MFTGERASWQNPKVLTTLFLVFVMGAFAGAISMQFGLHRLLHPHAPSPSLSLRADRKDVFLDTCKKELDLTPQQAEKISLVLDDYKSYYENLQIQLEDIRATGKTRILQLLDDKQKAKFEQLLKDIQK